MAKDEMKTFGNLQFLLISFVFILLTGGYLCSDFRLELDVRSFATRATWGIGRFRVETRSSTRPLLSDSGLSPRWEMIRLKSPLFHETVSNLHLEDAFSCIREIRIAAETWNDENPSRPLDVVELLTIHRDLIQIGLESKPINKWEYVHHFPGLLTNVIFSKDTSDEKWRQIQNLIQHYKQKLVQWSQNQSDGDLDQAFTNATFAGTALRALHRGDPSAPLVISNALRIARDPSYPSPSRTAALLILEDCARSTSSTSSTSLTPSTSSTPSTLAETATAVSADPSASPVLRQTADAVLKRLAADTPNP